MVDNTCRWWVGVSGAGLAVETAGNGCTERVKWPADFC